MTPQRIPIAATLTVFMLCAGTATAQSSDNEITIRKSVIAGGTTVSSGGDFRVSATAGQHDTGMPSNGELAVHGGFWSGRSSDSDPIGDEIFRDGFEQTQGEIQ